MSINNPYQTYQTNSVFSAPPGELTLMLYNGCLKFIKQAHLAIQNKNIEQKNKSLQAAQNIILELMSTLNMDMDVSKQLMPLYDFIYRQLIQANLRNDLTVLTEAERLVTEFRDMWKEVIQINKQKQTSQGGQA
ncbi:flagellar export chaperone FliS [Heyndrickxia acidicola]|uniref:Flagellar secretion chaperone FliS n=1 Tax=Heyndrickxia acidicola TaxID=209389 RepID=A0ABU6MIU4_9BACI|nr:flagellar export chaperone FliS [Heyndrickxia acidicola]MED1204384.1 flagellar export chaperone FliS [Heyndrickxia acidicola]